MAEKKMIRRDWFGIHRIDAHISEFRSFSTWTSAVDGMSSVNVYSFKTKWRARFGDWTSHSQTPPKCGAARGLKL
jgi:hypothetical protein